MFFHFIRIYRMIVEDLITFAGDVAVTAIRSGLSV